MAAKTCRARHIYPVESAFTFDNSITPNLPRKNPLSSPALWLKRGATATTTVITALEFIAAVTEPHAFVTNQKNRTQVFPRSLHTQTERKVGGGMAVTGNSSG